MTSVIQRRKLHFDSLEEALAEAERLSDTAVITTGSYSLGQILEHLARTIDVVTGFRESPPVSLPIRMVARMLKSRFLNRPMRSGFKLPSKSQSVFWPSEEVETAAGLRHFRESIDRFDSTEPLPRHILLGEMTRPEHVQLQCRHAELHLSFVHPAEESVHERC